MYVPRAMYSLRMSFWTVPPQLLRRHALLLADRRVEASRMAAVALMVIEVETLPSGMPLSSVSMSPSESMATPTLPDLAAGARVVGVAAHLGGQVEGHREAGLPVPSR